MIRARNQTKETMCIALFNRDLHRNNICPANHEVGYSRGWFYFDGQCKQKPEMTAEAERMLKEGFEVLYWPEGNTYVLGFGRMSQRG